MVIPPTEAPIPAEQPKAVSPPVVTPSHRGRNHTLWWFTLGIIVVGLAWFLLWFFYLQYYESTDDAYANGNMININAAVPGSVVAFFADDTDLVMEGQLLVLLDRTDYQVQYDKELAALAATVLQVRQLYDTVKVNLANVDTKRIALARTKYDHDNRQQLVGTRAISDEDYTHSKDDLSTALFTLQQAEYQLQVALAAVGNTPPEKHPMIDQQQGSVRNAFYNLTHCAIHAPATGYVAQRSVDVGEWVTTTRALMAVIPKDYVWVDANFKETQLTYMRIGQPTTVWFDMYGSKVKYTGKVLGIASGSGSVFSLIPPQNATGNWIKIVQRLPVRISLDPETLKDYPMRLGISANVDVDISDYSGPKLAETLFHQTRWWHHSI